MQFKLALNRDQIDECRRLARQIAEHIQKYADRHGSLAIEQAVLRALGVSNVLARQIASKLGPDATRLGVAGWLGRTMVARKLTAQKAADYLARHGLGKGKEIHDVAWSQAQRTVRDALQPWLKSIQRQRSRNPQPTFKMAAVMASGNAKTDLEFYNKWHHQLDLVTVRLPKCALQETVPVLKRSFFRRQGYPVVEQLQRLTQTPVCWAGAGGAAPDFMVLLAGRPQMRLQHDPLAAMHQVKLSPQRAVVDYQFVLKLAAKLGVPVQSYQGDWASAALLDTHAHQVLAMQLVLEQWAVLQRIDWSQQAMELAATVWESEQKNLLAVLSRSQLYRELFHQSELWHHSAATHAGDWLWDVGVAGFSEFTGVVLGHHLAAAEQLRPLGKALSGLALECHFTEHGQLTRHVHTLLERSMKEIQRIYRTGWFKTIEQDHGGVLGGLRQTQGQDTVFEKDKRYWNPLEE